LSRWKSLWGWTRQRTSQRLLRRSGFSQYADEYWWLAQLKMYEATAEDTLVFEDDQMHGVRHLVERFSAPHGVDDLEFAI
jgi:hypothetical protein